MKQDGYKLVIEATQEDKKKISLGKKMAIGAAGGAAFSAGAQAHHHNKMINIAKDVSGKTKEEIIDTAKRIHGKHYHGKNLAKMAAAGAIGSAIGVSVGHALKKRREKKAAQMKQNESY